MGGAKNRHGPCAKSGNAALAAGVAPPMRAWVTHPATSVGSTVLSLAPGPGSSRPRSSRPNPPTPSGRSAFTIELGATHQHLALAPTPRQEGRPRGDRSCGVDACSAMPSSTWAEGTHPAAASIGQRASARTPNAMVRWLENVEAPTKCQKVMSPLRVPASRSFPETGRLPDPADTARHRAARLATTPRARWDDALSAP